MLPQRGDLHVDASPRRRPTRWRVGPEEVERVHLVWREALVDRRLRKRHRVAGRRIDSVDRGDGRCPVVGVLDVAIVADEHGGVHGQNGVGPKGADDADELLAERQVVLERAIRAMQERDALVARRSLPPPAALPRGRRASSSGSVAGRRRRRRRSCSTPDARREPSWTQRSMVPAGPKSASSGWATMTRIRSGDAACRVGFGVRHRCSPSSRHGPDTRMKSHLRGPTSRV